MVGRPFALRPRRGAWRRVVAPGALGRRLRSSLPGGTDGPVTRYLLPAAALLLVTAIVLVVRSELRAHRPGAAAGPAAASSLSHTPPPRLHRTHPAGRYYLVRSGDTLEAIAARTRTSVALLLRLNPGIQPTALRPGQSIRVK